MPSSAVTSAALLIHLKPLLKRLTDDLISRASTEAVLRAELERSWGVLRSGQRTAEPFALWVEGYAQQVAAAWVLSALFVRVLEDRGLLARRRLAGPGAEDSEQQFRKLFLHLGMRDYLHTVFDEVASVASLADVFDRAHNPLWRLGLSEAGALELLQFLRSSDDSGLRLTFGVAGESDLDETRLLGDLYQDMNESVQKRFALLQTPDFVESFILDLTLEEAIKKFGLEKVKVIDPTCGSGHFVLGAFRRLVAHYRRDNPAMTSQEIVQRVISQVAGTDINPYAVAITRFRLTLAALRALGHATLADVPALHFNLAVADSLLVTSDGQKSLGDAAGFDEFPSSPFGFDIPADSRRILIENLYHAVVGNPPYISPKDAVLRDEYRKLYKSASGKYTLSVPFVERFFHLAVPGGVMGMINSNAFMKREFGKALIENVLPNYKLTHVINTEGAYIPGHGTPTVILVGKRESPPPHWKVLTVLGRRGEPTTPENPAEGFVWSSIKNHFRDIGYENDFITVTELPKEKFFTHPWSLQGGGASGLKDLIESKKEKILDNIADALGVMAVTGEDDVYIVNNKRTLLRFGLEETDIKPFGIGENIRDWAATDLYAIYPHDEQGRYRALPKAEKWLWKYRAVLERAIYFGKTMRERGLDWREYAVVVKDKLRTPLSISFAFVATHNHFVLDRGGKVFNRTAPIIKLPAGTSEDEHLALLGYLNSSVACFWMKQVCFNKGANSDKGVLQDDPERFRFEFDGTKLLALPIPNMEKYKSIILDISKAIDCRASTLSNILIAELIDKSPTSIVLTSNIRRKIEDRDRLRAEMIALQEELDWVIYEVFNLFPSGSLLSSSTIANGLNDLAPIADPDLRPYRFKDQEKIPNIKMSLQWYNKLDAIKSDNQLNLLESPEYKRRWFRSQGTFNAENITDNVLFQEAFKNWLLDRIEDEIKQETEAQTVRDIADRLAGDTKVVAVAEVYAGGAQGLAEVLTGLVEGEAVPYLAAMRYTDSGLAKRAVWEQTWEAQRREDAGETGVQVPLPPKYQSTDFRKPDYWRHRGKLDVPRERFIAYPGEEGPGESPRIGWAGWDDLQQTTALAQIYQSAQEQQRPAITLIPLLAGIRERLPWLKQWHNDPDPNTGVSVANAYSEYLWAQMGEVSLEVDGSTRTLNETDLTGWRPSSGRPPRAPKASNSQTPKTPRAGRPQKVDPSNQQILSALATLDPQNLGIDPKTLATHLACSDASLRKLIDDLEQQGSLAVISKRPKRIKLLRQT